MTIPSHSAKGNKDKAGRTPRPPSPNSPAGYFEAYCAFYGVTPDDADFPLATLPGGKGRACKVFDGIKKAGITPAMLPFFLISVDLKYDQELRRKGLQFPDIPCLQMALHNKPLIREVITDLSPRTRFDGTTVPSPWTPEYYPEAARPVMTREPLLRFRRQRIRPAQWWEEHRREYLPDEDDDDDFFPDSRYLVQRG